MQCPNEKEQKDKINNDLKKTPHRKQMIEQHEPPKNILHEYLFSLFPVDFFLSYETKYIKRMLENNIKSFHFTFLYALLQMIASH
jgi:hypothetical protein